jgi:hypothetical protein
MDFEFIDDDAVEVSKRGRKSSVSPELVEAMKNAPAGKAVALREFAGDPADEDYKSYKAAVSAMLRSAGKQAGKTVAIAWSPSGVPQVRFVAPKTKRK